MHMVGLFDRPASGDCLRALHRAPAIDGLTGAVVALDEGAWQRAVARLREVRLLAPPDPAAPDALDAHPLVREWFGERLKATNDTAWKAAHGRLYEHLRDTTQEGKTPTLEDLAPLYQAIAHGCRAGRHRGALSRVYKDRICRRRPDGVIEFYASKKLGALGSSLAAISWFFEKPYETPLATLTEADRSWMLGQAAVALRAQGRFSEALIAQRVALDMYEAAGNYVGAAIDACNLSGAQLLVGQVAAALVSAKRAVGYVNRPEVNDWWESSRAAEADALHASGRSTEAQGVFRYAEERQKELQSKIPLLYSLQGYQYCDLLLANGDWTVARDRAAKTIEIARRNNWLLDVALDTLTLGRAHLGSVMASIVRRQSQSNARDDVRSAASRLEDAVEGLRTAGQSDRIPSGLLARAAFHRSVGDWDGAARDLDEVEEIAGPGPMRLFLCDMALERARLAFARGEAFAPLNGLIDDSPPKPQPPGEADRKDDSPPKPQPPGEADRKSLHAEAAKQLAIAAEYIKTCGYHRRDEELAELQAVLRGDRLFADLPARV
jgi:tetratricopeptide (TPR) repeat protein